MEGAVEVDEWAGLLQLGLWSLRAGPALILVLLIVIVGLTTPVFLTSRNVGVLATGDRAAGTRSGITLLSHQFKQMACQH